MNHLAHFHLAHHKEGLVVGALLADYIKGPLADDIPADLAAGIRLHRRIDSFTDTHPLLTEGRANFPRSLRRYAGVLIDLSFDHFLARHWREYHHQSLDEFSQSVYAQLHRNRARMNPPANEMATRMQEYDLLARYREWAMVAQVAERIGRRFSRGNPFTGVHELLDPQYAALADIFTQFYPELLEHSRREAVRLLEPA